MYKLLINEKNREIEVKSFNDLEEVYEAFEKEIDGYKVAVNVNENHGQKIINFSVSSKEDKECYLSLYGKNDPDEMFSFEDKVKNEGVLRQSPHDYKHYNFVIDGNTMPVIAENINGKTLVYISDNPSHCLNYTTQYLKPETGEFYLSSGDNGQTPNFVGDPVFEYYHKVGNGKIHTFRFIITESEAPTMKKIHKACFMAINKAWGEGKDSIYYAMSFSGNYMHIRYNESGTSNIWVVPALKYANCLYVRDSFYQTFILSSEVAAECERSLPFRYENSGTVVLTAENPLIYMIWIYRTAKEGKEYDKDKANIIFDIIKKLYRNGSFFAECREDGTFRNWFDICAFEHDDVDTYTQGYLCVALRCAMELGYDAKEMYEGAKSKYLTMFNGEFLPLSEKKNYLSQDVIDGDLIHFLLFGEKLLPDEQVQKTYYKYMSGKAKTPYGTKIVCDVDGEFLPNEGYAANGYLDDFFVRCENGRYAKGGSYHIYEMMFHVDAYIHNCEGALDNMKWRLAVDVNFDGCTHEYMHTVRGFGSKLNQGWNAFIYKAWSIIMEKGLADNEYFDYADNLINSQN